VRTSTRTLRPATREVAQRAQRHARVLRSGRRESLAGGARSAESCRGDLAILRALLSGRGLGAVVVACALKSSSKDCTACLLQCCTARHWQPRTCVGGGAFAL
jgi:hypothetical protein